VKDVERWVQEDGDAPEALRPTLDALRGPPRPEAAVVARAAQRVLARIDEVAARAAPPPPPRKPAHLAVTAPLPDLPPEVHARNGRLPFVPPELSPSRGTKRTVKSPVMSRAGGTTPSGDDSITRAVAALPFVAAAAFPAFTIVQYASLCVELAAFPERTEVTLARYGVAGPAARRALDEHWRRWLAARPDLAPRFEWARQRYATWLRTGT
jgi:hypothetical protein